MDNLWPTNLISDTPPALSEQITAVLAFQAKGIADRTQGLVQAELRQRVSPIGRSMSLFLYPANRPAQGFEFMAFRSPGEEFPAAVEVFHLGERLRTTRIENLEELRKSLRKIFANPATLRIVRKLAIEARLCGPGEEAEDTPSSAAAVSPRPEKNSARPIAIGGILQQDAKPFAQVTLLGVSGFISAEEIRTLTLRQGSTGSPVEPLNDRYVVTLSFLDKVKMTLSAEELDVLQSEARKALVGRSS